MASASARRHGSPTSALSSTRKRPATRGDSNLLDLGASCVAWSVATRGSMPSLRIAVVNSGPSPKRQWPIAIEGLYMLSKEAQPIHSETQHPQRMTKKHQIIALYLSGITEIEDLATITGAQPSYVGAVLQQAGLIRGYFDLYTSTAHPMNVYSKLVTNKLGFKNEATARHSVEVLEELYQQFAMTRDRAGQHHALSMALVMFDRARWIGKMREADIFRQWLVAHLEQAEAEDTDHTAARGEPVSIVESAREPETVLTAPVQ